MVAAAAVAVAAGNATSWGEEVRMGRRRKNGEEVRIEVARVAVPECFVAVTGRTTGAVEPGNTRGGLCSAVRRAIG